MTRGLLDAGPSGDIEPTTTTTDPVIDPVNEAGSVQIDDAYRDTTLEKETNVSTSEVVSGEASDPGTDATDPDLITTPEDQEEAVGAISITDYDPEPGQDVSTDTMDETIYDPETGDHSGGPGWGVTDSSGSSSSSSESSEDEDEESSSTVTQWAETVTEGGGEMSDQTKALLAGLAIGGLYLANEAGYIGG